MKVKELIERLKKFQQDGYENIEVGIGVDEDLNEIKDISSVDLIYKLSKDSGAFWIVLVPNNNTTY